MRASSWKILKVEPAGRESEPTAGSVLRRIPPLDDYEDAPDLHYSHTSASGPPQPFWRRLSLLGANCPAENSPGIQSPARPEEINDGENISEYQDDATGTRSAKSPGPRSSVCFAFVHTRLSAGGTARRRHAG